MGATLLGSRYGKIHRLANNPNQISDAAFTTLVESLSRGDDADFMKVRGLVVWFVPSDLSETMKERNQKSPFIGQDGKYVILGGNQRYLALQHLGYERIPDEWLHDAKHPNGEWWTPEEAERFVLLDNNPEGISGERDYDKMIEAFNRECMRVVGIDFANLPQEEQAEAAKPVEEEVEEGEHGEKDEALQDFIERRENSRGVVEEMTEVGFYCVPVFETHAQTMQFIDFLREKNPNIHVDRDTFINGFELAEILGCHIERANLKFPDPKPEKALQEMAMDGTKEGWEVRGDDDIPVGTDESEEEEAGADGDGGDL